MNSQTNKSYTFLLLLLACFASVTVSSQELPVRNQVPRVGQQEIVMMRHAFLEKGTYPRWYQQSTERVWPWFERLGARMLGDFQVIYPDTPSSTPDRDEALRFARYASYEHWQATRGNEASGDTGGSIGLAGNGGLLNENNAGLANRGEISTGSKGGLFLRGYLADNGPIYMPGTGEQFEGIDSGDYDVNPVRLAAARARDEIMALEYRRVTKGSFEEFHIIAKNDTWPYLGKVGVRPVGQWQVAYLPNSSAVESEDYDEIYSLYRFASYDHYRAVLDDVMSLGGDGPDFDLFESGVSQLNAFTQQVSVQFLKGPLWTMPPHYAPPLPGKYRLAQ